MSKEEKIMLDATGYADVLKEIEILNDSLKKVLLEKGDAFAGAAGDGWHDNFAFEEANRQELMIRSQIQERYDLLSRATIVKRQSEELIDIGDIVFVNMMFSEDDIEAFEFKLVSNTNLDSAIKEISINSPLGKTVYHKSVGEYGSYEVNGRKISVQIAGKNYQIEDSFDNGMVKKNN